MTIKLRLVKLERRAEFVPGSGAGTALHELRERFARLRDRLGDQYLPNPSLAEVMAGCNCSDEARQRLRDYMQEKGWTDEHVAVLTGRPVP